MNIQDGRALDVTDSKDVEGHAVGVKTRSEGKNQKWKIVYVDESKTQTKGLNKDFGFYIDRPFYIVSRLPVGRVIESTSSTMKIMRYKKGRIS